MTDPIPHLTSIEHRARGEDDDYTHIAVTVGAFWIFFIAWVANWIAGG